MRGKVFMVGLKVCAVVAALALMTCPRVGRAMEHVTLTNGFELDCARREPVAATGTVRLYLAAAPDAQLPEGGYLEVAAGAIRLVEPVADLPVAPAALPKAVTLETNVNTLLADAGERHHLDVDLLASLVRAESGGRAAAVSKAGARGLMQLMPGTAAVLGVADAMQPEQNIAGGTEYLDRMMTRYHDDVALALAAYNAGPGAVDRWHGVPPYRETRAYVARIITEFNRRKRLALQAVAQRP